MRFLSQLIFILLFPFIIISTIIELISSGHNQLVDVSDQATKNYDDLSLVMAITIALVVWGTIIKLIL